MIFHNLPISYKSMVMNKFYEMKFSSMVIESLAYYDLPDLIGCIAPRKVVLAGLKDQMLEPATAGLIEEELAFPRKVFSSEKVPGNLDVLESYGDIDSIIEKLLN